MNGVRGLEQTFSASIKPTNRCLAISRSGREAHGARQSTTSTLVTSREGARDQLVGLVGATDPFSPRPLRLRRRTNGHTKPLTHGVKPIAINRSDTIYDPLK